MVNVKTNATIRHRDLNRERLRFMLELEFSLARLSHKVPKRRKGIRTVQHEKLVSKAKI